MRDWGRAKSAACHAAQQTFVIISFWEREGALSLALLLARVKVKVTGECSAGVDRAPNYPMYSNSRKDKEIRNSHQMEYDLVTRINNLGLHLIAWVNLTSILLKKEVRQKSTQVVRVHKVQKQVARSMLGAIRVMPIHVEGRRVVWRRQERGFWVCVSNVLLLDQVMGQLMKIF